MLRRPPLRDAACAILLCAAAEAETLAQGDGVAFAAAVPFFTLALAWRTTHALAVAVLSAAALTVSSAVSPADWSSIAAVAAVLLVAYSVASHEPGERAGAGGVALLVGLLVQTAFIGDGDLVFGAVILGAAWLAGRGARARRRQADRLRELTERLEREREANAQLAVAAERARVARDLHDAIAGLLNVMVVQAAVAEMCLEESLPSAAAAVAVVQQSGRDASVELARMLELLGGGAELQPQPTLARIGDLVAWARGAGADVRLEARLPAEGLPAALELSAYRIVQEALTNVLKHARGASARVRVHFDGEQLELDVTDDGARAGALVSHGDGGGHGLVNMAERAALFGGEVQTGPVDGGGYRVRARLPVGA